MKLVNCPIELPNDEVCDTTGGDSSNAAGYITQIASALQIFIQVDVTSGPRNDDVGLSNIHYYF